MKDLSGLRREKWDGLGWTYVWILLTNGLQDGRQATLRQARLELQGTGIRKGQD